MKKVILGEQGGILTEMQQQFLERVKANVEQMGHLLNDLVSIASPDSQPIELSPQPVDLTEIIEEAVMGLAARFRERRLAVRLDLPSELPMVQADHDSLYQIMLRLLSNAVLCSKEGTEVLIMARSADMARVYHVLTRASIAIARRALHGAGYHLVEYGGASGLAPEEDLAAEELGLYIRRVTVTADRRVSITIPASAEFDVDVYSGDEILVLSSDQTDASGTAGGVDV